MADESQSWLSKTTSDACKLVYILDRTYPCLIMFCKQQGAINEVNEIQTCSACAYLYPSLYPFSYLWYSFTIWIDTWHCYIFTESLACTRDCKTKKAFSTSTKNVEQNWLQGPLGTLIEHTTFNNDVTPKNVNMCYREFNVSIRLNVRLFAAIYLCCVPLFLPRTTDRNFSRMLHPNSH